MELGGKECKSPCCFYSRNVAKKERIILSPRYREGGCCVLYSGNELLCIFSNNTVLIIYSGRSAIFHISVRQQTRSKNLAVRELAPKARLAELDQMFVCPCMHHKFVCFFFPRTRQKQWRRQRREEQRAERREGGRAR